MTPQELYRTGELDQAIKALGEELRSNPLDAKRRTFLFRNVSLPTSNHPAASGTGSRLRV
jgi:protein involved in temperature-dependent protein secretion